MITRNTRSFRIYLALMAMLAMTLPGLASATSNTGPVTANFHALRLGYTALHFNRAEHGSSGQTYDTNKGWINGLNFGGEYVGPNLYVDTGAYYADGSVNYKGGVQYGTSGGGTGEVPYKTNMDEQLFTVHGDVGPDFHLFNGRDAIAPFVGLGYRYHYDHTSAGQVTIPGYGSARVPSTAASRQQGEARFGLMDRFQITRKLGLELKMLGTYSFWGRIQNQHYNGKYSNKWGYDGSVTADYQLMHHFGVYGRASYRKVNTSRVQLASTAFEPKATSKDTRLTAGIQASF